MIRNNSTDRGVSPVIGVVLMIAVTVIIAAVVGSAVLDFSGDISPSAQGSVEFDENPNGQIDTTDNGSDDPDTDVHTLEVQITDLNNAESVSIKAEDTDNTKDETENPDSTDNSGSDLTDYDPSVDTTVSEVGDIGKVSQLTDGDKVSVVVENEEGDTNVIQTHTVGE